ncbi:MAG: hypothetical protein RCH30_3210 [Candidatus Phytoplasma australasiaticum]|nr:hypothetical protein EPWB_v2c2670 ['Echinacea purpurea' witches'-broom phytoplasma]WEX20474.1 MAG: hypothetical protein TB2022_3950 [Candidatus Phytoplasma aurantifolia]WKV64118.1 MAG: hypothetical protein NCHU2022_c2680 [Candidatus Phytoplasma australasiaticum]WMW50207.1 MAG: hypothetical protein RCH30_3210 [Candidatus Phytoplasma australasiaticum]
MRVYFPDKHKNKLIETFIIIFLIKILYNIKIYCSYIVY